MKYLLTGLAMTGIASASTASSATNRIEDLLYMVWYLLFRFQDNRTACCRLARGIDSGEGPA